MENFVEKIENQQCRACYNSTKGLRLLTNQTKCSAGNQQQQKSYAELLQEVSNINVSFPFKWQKFSMDYIVANL